MTDSTNDGTAPVRPADSVRGSLASVEQLAGGLTTAFLALLSLTSLLAAGLACLTGVGLALLAPALRGLRATADRERARLSRMGPEVLTPYASPVRGWRSALTELRAATFVRDVGWACLHASAGLALGLLGVLLPVVAVRDTTFPVWWTFLPDGAAGSALGLPAGDWPTAALVALMGVGWCAIVIGLGPGMARLQAYPGRALLGPPPGAELVDRITELTASRAAALDAHTRELRRIERSLHDGAQSRLVTVAVLLGSARRALDRDRAAAESALEQAQESAETALSELRGLSRAILPPALDHGLADALSGLAADCPLPCQVDTTQLAPCPVSVEAAAYFAVAEALSNVTQHSGATRAEVWAGKRDGRLVVRVVDDGRGGAREDEGTGLRGIRQRARAHDGTVEVTSPDTGSTTVHVELPCE
ncbi:histidine kinase [Haloactinospora alba]|uniref:histidine kinase n=1 Tax=Haloactinospora alba TaxID=405555 RepID=A0A543N7I3_9ACTN|nr:sensor histidine kinase [Haloactinospora alba]TQN27786.1 histidine kinase [Haloactinospora alba]